MSRTPFDTARLDAECARVAREHPWNHPTAYSASFEPIKASEVKALLLGNSMPVAWHIKAWRDFAIETFNMVRRPKAVKA